MVAQGVLPFQYELDSTTALLTGLAGLPAYLDLAHVAGLRDSITRHVNARPGGQGWTDAQFITDLVLLNLAGGDCVDDVEKLEGDVGLCEVIRRVEWHGLPRRERRRLLRRWRKEQKRTVPSPSPVRNYLSWFHNDAEERKREKGVAFIPAKNEALAGLVRVIADQCAFLQKHRPQRTATIDQDATLVQTHKKEALYCYKSFPAYQPLNSYWAEQRVVVHSEFRDGNVPAGWQQLRVFKEALACIPEGVLEVFMRSDTAGYQWDLLRYCEEGRNERFGRIEFAVGADICDSFKRAALEVVDDQWHAITRPAKNGGVVDTGQQWAEVCYVPDALGQTKKGHYRFIAIREPVRQRELFDEPDQYSFPVLQAPDAQGRAQTYKLTAIVTNRMEAEAQRVIQWYRNRCGNSEEAHSIMKSDLAGGRLPSKLFGANAAWWAIMILALNLDAIMKRLVLGERWVTRRMKAIRYWLINVAGRMVRSARRLVVRLTDGHPSSDLLLSARAAIAALATGPPG